MAIYFLSIFDSVNKAVNQVTNSKLGKKRNRATTGQFRFGISQILHLFFEFLLVSISSIEEESGNSLI